MVIKGGLLIDHFFFHFLSIINFFLDFFQKGEAENTFVNSLNKTTSSIFSECKELTGVCLQS